MMDMLNNSLEQTHERVPPGMRKSLLKSNIRSLIEKTSMDRVMERKVIEENLKRISSLEVVDREIETIENERYREIAEARKALLEAEKELEEEMERLLSEM